MSNSTLITFVRLDWFIINCKVQIVICMVLKPSDYSIPEPGENLDPTDPVGFLSRFSGMVLALGVVVFALGVARNKIAPLMDEAFSSVTGGLVSSSESSGGPWDGV